MSFSAFKGAPDKVALHQLAKSLPWKLYVSKGLNVYLLDVFNPRHIKSFPFCSIPAVQDLPLDFDVPLNELNELYETLRKKNRGNGFRRALVNLNLILSRLTGGDVLSCISDDEDMDLACISSQGNLRMLRFRAGGMEISWSEAVGVTQVKRNSSQLHRIVEAECTSFLGTSLPIFGFDGDITALDLEVIDTSSPLPPSQPKPPRGGWEAYERNQRELSQTVKKWWQFWK